MTDHFGIPSIGKFLQLAEQRFPAQQCAGFLSSRDFDVLYNDAAAMRWDVEKDRIVVGSKLVVYRDEMLNPGTARLAPIQFVTHSVSATAGDAVEVITGVTTP